MRYLKWIALGVCLVIILVSADGWATAQAQDDATLSGEVVSLHFADTADATRLAAHYDVWYVDHRTKQLIAYVTPEQRVALERDGYSVQVDKSRTLGLHRALAPAPNQLAGIPNFACYRTVEETYASMSKLAKDHPQLANWIDIGDSWLKLHGTAGQGYDIRALVLTNHDRPGPKPRFFLMAAIHAREYATAETAARFAERMVSGYGVDPDITWLLDYNEIHIVTQSNPDGRKRAETGVWWRKNVNNQDGCVYQGAFGTDLNRNSSFKWGACEEGYCSSPDPCDEIYRGTAAASEPETQALQDYMSSVFVDQRGPADTDAAPADTTGLMISLHSYGKWVLFPWGWNATPSPNNTQLQTLGRKFGFYTNYVVCQSGGDGCIYQTDGTTDDWAYGELGIAAYTIEVGTEFFESCSYFESDILEQLITTLTFAAKAARLPYQSPAGPEIVDAAAEPACVAAGDPVTLTVTADDSRFASNSPYFGSEPIQNIAAVSYTVDLPAWITGAVSNPMAAVDGFDTPVEPAVALVTTTGWSDGRHQLFVEGQDADGNMGVPTAVFVTIDKTCKQSGTSRSVFLPWVP